MQLSVIVLSEFLEFAVRGLPCILCQSIEKTSPKIMLADDGKLTHLPGGIDQYLNRAAVADQTAVTAKPKVNTWQLQKDLTKLERKLEKLTNQIADIGTQMASAAIDNVKLLELQQQLSRLQAEQQLIELDWERIAGQLEDS